MEKEIVWLHGEVKTPPFSVKASEEVDFFLFQLQQGEALSLPHSRPMPSIGHRCHELRIRDRDNYWRIVYRIDGNAILIGEVFSKKTS
jgi:phage-related protein